MVRPSRFFAGAFIGAQIFFGGQPAAGAQLCLAFDEALAVSAARDPAVRSAAARRDEAGADLQDARSLYRPQISAFGRSGVGDVGLVDSVIQNQVGVRASQRIFDFGDAKYARRAARSALGASEEDLRQSRIEAAVQTGLAYIDQLEAIAQLEATKERRAYFSRQLQSVDALLSRGGATRLERAEVAAEIADAEALTLELQFRREEARTRVEIDTGAAGPPCGLTAAQVAMDVWLEDVANAQDAVARALNASPSVRALQARAKSAEARRRRERRTRLPVIDVVAVGAYSSTGGDGDFSFQDRVGVDVSVPLYSGNAISARNKRAAAREDLARAQLSEARRQLEEDVRISYRRVISLRAQAESLRILEEQKRLRFEAAEREFDAGVRTLRNLVEDRVDLEEAVLSANRTEHEAAREALRLLALTAAIPFAGEGPREFGAR